MKHLLRLTVLVLASCVPLASQAVQPVQQLVQSGWQFRLADPRGPEAKAHPEAASWRKATVPGMVQTDLLAAGLIPDPYVGNAEAGLQWIGLADWQYATTFDVGPELWARSHIELLFEGLDTY